MHLVHTLCTTRAHCTGQEQGNCPVERRLTNPTDPPAMVRIGSGTDRGHCKQIRPWRWLTGYLLQYTRRMFRCRLAVTPTPSGTDRSYCCLEFTVMFLILSLGQDLSPLYSEDVSRYQVAEIGARRYSSAQVFAHLCQWERARRRLR